MQNYLFIHMLILSEILNVSGDSMFLSGILGMILWIMSRRWFKSYKYPYQLILRIVVQIGIIGLISILSTTIVSIPRFYGDISAFLPLSYPLMMHWGISGYLVWPPHHYFTISMFGLDITGGGSGREFSASTAFRWEIFLHSMPLFLLINVVFTGALLLLIELWKFCKKRIMNE